MAVNWYWKIKVGEILYYDEENKQAWKLQLFGGNCMCAIIYRYRKKNEETGKLERWYNFFMWLDDIDHAKRILKDDADFFKNMAIGKHKLRKFRININLKNKYRNKEMLKFAELLTKYKYKVELY